MRTVAISILLVAGSCGNVDAGSGNPDAVLLGSCTEKPDEQGGFMCIQAWQVPTPGIDGRAMYKAACGDGVYSATPCGGGAVPGCCTIGSATQNTMRTRSCYHVSDGDPEGVLRRQCDAFDGTWE